jgi:DNA polymerase-3 subunit gamma/tau
LEERVKLLEDKMKNGITVMNTTISKEKKDSYETNNLMMQNNVENGKEKKVQVNTNVSKEKDIISTRNMQTANLKSQDFWPNILQQLKANGKLMIYANLLNSRAVEINDMTIGIEFSGGLNEFRKKLLEKNENISEIQKLVSIACGKEMQIKYIDKPVGEIIQTQTKKIEEKKFSSNRKMQSENDIINSLDALENLGLPIDYIDE